MNLVGGHPVSLSSSDSLKMEERKRPASNDHDSSAPPLKKQATSVNGTRAHPDADMPWKDDLEVSLATALLPFNLPIGSMQYIFYLGLVHCADILDFPQRFTKEAILRQMKEIQRERDTTEKRLHEFTKRTAYHDDHLRIIDAWFCQVSIFSSVTRYGI